MNSSGIFLRHFFPDAMKTSPAHDRPDPDALLAQVQQEEQKAARGVFRGDRAAVREYLQRAMA